MIHRVAQLQLGQRALVNAANGGVGQALLDLLRAHGVEAIGAAAVNRHDVVRSYGATPIDGRGSPLQAAVRTLHPRGVDAAFDAVGGAQTGQCLASLERGGTLAWYGFMGASSTWALLRSAANVFILADVSARQVLRHHHALAARRANERLEAGNIEGKLVLFAQ